MGYVVAMETGNASAAAGARRPASWQILGLTPGFLDGPCPAAAFFRPILGFWR
jgi:transcription elongation factor